MASIQRVSALLLSGLICGLSAACGGTGSETGQRAAAPPTAEPETKPEELVIRAWSGTFQEVYAKTAGKAFTEDTGISIKWDTSDEAVSYAKLNRQIADGEEPNVDASFNAQQRAYTDAARQWTVPISSEVAPNLEEVTPDVAKPPDAATDEPWPYIVPYTLSVPFIVRTDKVDPETIRSWEDLTAPDLEESIALDSIYSSSAFGVAAALDVDPAEDPPGSMDPVWDFLADLKPNLAQLGSNADVVTALTTGSVKVAVSNTGSGIDAMNAGVPVKMVAPEEGLYVVGDAYFIHRGIPDENAYYAQLFANYLLDSDVQSQVAEELGYVPVNPSATVPKYMSDDPSVFPRTPEDLKAAGAVLAPVSLMARYDSQWQKAFDNVILD